MEKTFENILDTEYISISTQNLSFDFCKNNTFFTIKYDNKKTIKKDSQSIILANNQFNNTIFKIKLVKCKKVILNIDYKGNAPLIIERHLP